MRILIYDQIRRELEGYMAFNLALLRAIDPRLITHRPRDPDKARLMKELGMETTIPETPPKGAPKGSRRHTRTSVKRLLEDIDAHVDMDRE